MKDSRKWSLISATRNGAQFSIRCAEQNIPVFQFYILIEIEINLNHMNSINELDAIEDSIDKILEVGNEIKQYVITGDEKRTIGIYVKNYDSFNMKYIKYKRSINNGSIIITYDDDPEWNVINKLWAQIAKSKSAQQGDAPEPASNVFNAWQRFISPAR